ncbi:hypothetical protein [Eubacterium sp. F2]|uniref:hypothetical protein n=1 Tax=Eubacterium sp. F2 TaxID=3381348 RepID=UPI003908109D
MTEDINRFALQNLTEEEKNDLQKSLQIVLKTFMNGMVTLGTALRLLPLSWYNNIINS